jgi:predicted membrane protein
MSDRSPIVTPRLIVGLAIMIVGVLLFLDQIDRLDAEEYLLWWPVALIAVGLTAVIQAESKIGGVIAIAAGCWILLYNLGYVDIEVWDLWPLVLVILGGSMLVQAFRTRRPASSGSSANVVSAFAFIGGFERSNSSPEFAGGDLTAIMGGVEVDLRPAQIAEDEAVLHVFALWGGIDLKVPEGWTVVGKVMPIMGAFEDKTRPPRDGKKRLVVKGTVIMGGIEVKN